jgi:hypothetical protein
MRKSGPDSGDAIARKGPELCDKLRSHAAAVAKTTSIVADRG